MLDKKKQVYTDIAIVVTGIVLTVTIAVLLAGMGGYPAGSDTMSHIYKANLVYEAIGKGNPFPLYDPYTYNGTELISVSAPIPLYLLTLCQWLAGGAKLSGYPLYIAFLFGIGVLQWYLAGRKIGKSIPGAFLGVLWFFMPYNMYLIFGTGNLPRALGASCLPMLLSALYEVLQKGNTKALLKTAVAYILLGMCDIGLAVMTLAVLLLFLLIYGLLNWTRRYMGRICVTLICSLLIPVGLSFRNFLLVSGDRDADSMERAFQHLRDTLNPMLHLQEGQRGFYYGIILFVVAVFGICCSKRPQISGFVSGIVLVLLSMNSVYGITVIMPENLYWQMGHYLIFSTALVIYALLSWKTLRKSLLILLCGLLVLDTVPTLDLLWSRADGEIAENAVIAKAKEVTEQRVLLLDNASLESMGSYALTGGDAWTGASAGFDFAGAGLKNQLIQLNRALENGFYPYLFDRSMEMGNDTILIKMSLTANTQAIADALDSAAKSRSYEMIAADDEYRLYHMDIKGSWGTVSQYSGIAIGNDASALAMAFPSLQETTEAFVDSYSYEELSVYDCIYLSGFSYKDKEAAEELLIRLSENGVRIIIMADGIPEDRDMHAKEFLGVRCNDISFSNGYPLLDTKLGVLDCSYFPQKYAQWNTVYVNGLDEVWGSVAENDLKLPFYGTVHNDNIIVLGINLTLYYAETQDASAGRLLEDILPVSKQLLPERTVVPIQLSYEKNEIVLSSDDDGVNTTLAYHPSFRTKEEIEAVNGQLHINGGTTRIKIAYPYLWQGLLITLTGITGLVILLRKLRKEK